MGNQLQQHHPNTKRHEPKKHNVFYRLARWLFPWKGDTGKTVVLKIVFLVFLVVFLISGWLLLDYYINDWKAAGEYQFYQQVMSGETETEPQEEPVVMPEGYREEFAELYRINERISGWISIDGTAINYPVVQSYDNDYYLTHTLNGSWNSSGTPFLDYRCSFSPDALPRNSVVYAHNLNSGRMFHDIVNYKSVEYYKEHPVIHYNTVYQDYDWKIIGMFFTNADMSLEDSFPYHMFIDGTDEEFYALLNEAMQRSFFTTGVDVNANDKLLMLSTCDNSFDNSRIVLLARMVREGESSEVDVSAARQNPNQYLPQNYIDKFGGTYREFDPNYVFYTAS